MNDMLEFDPKDYYDHQLKDLIKENASKYFDDLVKEANTDVNKNIHTAEEIKKWEKIDKEGEKNLSKFRIIQGFMIAFIVIGFILVFLNIGALATSLIANDGDILIPTLLLVLGIILIPIGFGVIFGYTRKRIKHLKAEDLKNDSKLQELYNEAESELRALNNGFTSADFKNIVRKTTNIFDLDDSLEPLKFLMMQEVYGLDTGPSIDESIVGVASGEIKTNPFIRIKTFEKIMSSKVYTGSITIHWTETVSDGKGGTTRVSRSQVLTASISRPAPIYSSACYMIYGNEAAPDLVFSRQPSGISLGSDDKTIDKFVRSKEKDLQKMAEKSISKGGTFQPLANTKFESLFGATNRNHETQFRLLFTPLAQQNMVELIRSEPYGDDFSFYKKNKINIVSSIHGRSQFEYSEEAFRKYLDIRVTKEAFVNEISNLFSSIYFELAPFFAIPLYQTTEGGKFDLKRNYLRNVSDFEAEAVVNNMDWKRFYPNGAATSQILKVKYDKTIKNTDFFNVNSASYRTESRVEYETRIGGDGKSHVIPIYWTEYIPVSKVTSVAIRNFKGEEKEFNRLNASVDFHKECDKVFSGIKRNKNFIGFFNDECYNYDAQLDDKITSIVDSFLSK